MDPVTVGILGILVLLFLFVIEFPVAFAMGFVGFLGFGYLVGFSAGLDMLAIDIFENFSSYNLTVIPMFVLMGTLAFEIGMSSRLFEASHAIFGKMRGGLAIAAIMASAGFAAICGSTNATAAAMGAVSLPHMKRYDYDDSLATGCVAAAGSLGILIPPSALLIVFGIMAEESIGKLFIAGVLPGLLLALLFILTVIILCHRNPSLAPAGPSTSLKEKLAAVSAVGEVLILFCLVLGGLFTGWFSPTQAGGVGAAGVLILGLVRGKLTWRGFVKAGKDALLITCMVMFIVTGAAIFSHFFAVTKIPFLLSDWVSQLNFPPMVIMGLIVLLHLIGGCFMDGFGLIVLTVPIMLPMIRALGFDVVWFGIIIVLIVEMGTITPPVGVNVYVIKGVAGDVPLETIFKGIFPFLLALIIAVIILMVFPQIATFLPAIATY
ncbi:MAG: TRAP transporter large permease [Deltaproteobacteria bacterium]|nr:TRAP transporter large permease [Deltaproteobacteria bacterium]